MSVTAVPLQPIKRAHIVWLWVGLALAAAFALLLAWQGTRAAASVAWDDERFLAWHAGQPGVRTTESGLQYMVLEAGRGGSPSAGDIALIDFEGRLRDGTVFQPEQAGQGWRVGDGIPGFAEGLQLMSRGARYRFWLPPELGYGPNPPQGSRIPEDAVLIFDVTMTDFISEAEVREMQMQQQLQQQMLQQQMQEQLGGDVPAAEGGTGELSLPENAPVAQ